MVFARCYVRYADDWICGVIGSKADAEKVKSDIKRFLSEELSEEKTLINLRINMGLLLALMQQPLNGKSIEYADNRISLFSAQWGKCAITGKEFTTTIEIHCHHKIPKENGGTDEYGNLLLVLEPVHKLIHAKTPESVEYYKRVCTLNAEQMARLNKLRLMAGLDEIS